MKENLLQLILEWEMTKEEAFAFRLALLYLEFAEKYFPDHLAFFLSHHAGIPKRGDPRKCELFKYCWKLMKDTIGKLKVHEYRQYIQAQMSILSHIEKDGTPLFYGPRCLVNKPAWNRWIKWRKYFDAVKVSEPSLYKEDCTKKIITALQETHYVLKVRLGELTKQKIEEEMPFIMRLYKMDVVSPYFLLLSPVAKKYIKDNKLEIGGFTKQIENLNEECAKYYKLLFGEI